MTRAGRLAFVCPRYPRGATAGGAETLLKALAGRAAAAGRAVTFLTTCATDHFSWKNAVPAGVSTLDGVDVRFFPVDEDRDLDVFLRVQDAISRRRPVTPEEELLSLRNSVNSSALFEHLRRQAEAYDRIIAGPYLFGLTYFAALIRPEKTLLVPCLHDEPFAYLQSIAALFRRVHGLLFNTAPERNLACRLYGLDPARAAVVGLGLDPFEADAHAFARRRGLAGPYVIYSGRREPLKGTPLLVDYVDAFRKRTGRPVSLVLTGSGNVDIPGSLAGAVLDAGFLSEQEKHEAMAGAAAFCHPSQNESLGIVLLESWMARTPAIVRAGSEVLTEQCRRSGGGLWFRNYPEFEEELLLLLDRPALRNAMAEAGRRFVTAEYAWPAVERRLWAALDTL